MPISPDVLIGYQIAETRCAGKWRIALIAIQLLTTVPVAMSVYVASGKALFYLAAASLAALLIWWFVSGYYGKHRNAAQTARRVSIYTNGLGLTLSEFEWSQIKSSLLVSRPVAEAARRSDYYATNKAPSYGRLADIVEESAFYTRRVQQGSANTMGLVVGLFFLIGTITLVLGLPDADSSVLLTGVRFYLACTVFVMSSDVFGSMNAHRAAAQMASRVSSSLSRAHDGEISEGDIMLAATEYIAGMAKAPEPLPAVFAIQRKRLDADWTDWKTAHTS